MATILFAETNDSWKILSRKVKGFSGQDKVKLF